jgi:hypothetical protein
LLAHAPAHGLQPKAVTDQLTGERNLTFGFNPPNGTRERAARVFDAQLCAALRTYFGHFAAVFKYIAAEVRPGAEAQSGRGD